VYTGQDGRVLHWITSFELGAERERIVPVGERAFRCSSPYAASQTGKIALVSITMRVVLLLSAAIAAGCGGHSRNLRVATTTSVDNSGLLQAILPSFRQETGIDVQVLAVGSGRALQLLRRGDADVALTHERSPIKGRIVPQLPPGAGGVVFVHSTPYLFAGTVRHNVHLSSRGR
jgi:periplasmic binding family protein